MLAYPQLTSGAVTQFPVEKKHGLRTVVNTLEDGSFIKLADHLGETTEWRLQYVDLSDQEASALEAFFQATEGSLGVFTFLDPTANLLDWSDHLDHAVWIKGPMLTIAGGYADPTGGMNAWRLSNSSVAAQSLTQILRAPGGYSYCLSAYAKAPADGAVATLLRGTARGACALGSDWKRITFSGNGDAGLDTVEFGIEAPPEGSVDLYGMQVEAQGGASTYKPTDLGGVYPSAWFRDDSLSITATGVNRHSATVDIIHAIRL